MFGVVPRTMWEKSNPPDPFNRIIMGLNLLLVECGGELVLIDTGIGDKFDEKFKDIFSIERRPTLKDSLAEAGFSRHDITIVINTHLHFDHAGGNTIMNREGNPIPAFPSASYVVQKGEWMDAQNANERNRRSYLEGDFRPLETEGVLRLVDGKTELVDGLRLIPTPGHTGHHQSVLITSQGESVFFPGDLIPMSSHVPYPYIASIDLYPMDTLQQKKKILPKAFSEGWSIIFIHDPVLRIGKLEEKGGGFIALPYQPT
jgi:glyoxylase-like metal-dependent hydrolase (beta-lactamase superfamily II)